MSTFEVEIEKNNKNDKTFAKNVKVIYKKRAFQSISKILGGSGSFFAFISGKESLIRANCGRMRLFAIIF